MKMFMNLVGDHNKIISPKIFGFIRFLEFVLSDILKKKKNITELCAKYEKILLLTSQKAFGQIFLEEKVRRKFVNS